MHHAPPPQSGNRREEITRPRCWGSQEPRRFKRRDRKKRKGAPYFRAKDQGITTMFVAAWKIVRPRLLGTRYWCILVVSHIGSICLSTFPVYSLLPSLVNPYPMGTFTNLGRQNVWLDFPQEGTPRMGYALVSPRGGACQVVGGFGALVFHCIWP